MMQRYKKYSKYALLFIFVLSSSFIAGNIAIESTTNENNNANLNDESISDSPQYVDPSEIRYNETIHYSDEVSDVSDNIDSNLPSPKASDDYSSYLYNEWPLYDGFNNNQIDWEMDYSILDGSSGFGFIYIEDGWVWLMGEQQATNLPIQYNIPELPDDMSINSGNLVDENSHFEGGTFSVHFDPHGIKTIVKILTSVPYVSVQVSTFYINYRLSPDDSFLSHNLYTYSKSQYDSEFPVTVDLDIGNLNIDDYFEISMRLFCWDKDTYVRMDYANLLCYDLNVTEAQEPIPSNQDQQITVNFLETYFDLNTNGGTVAVYLNPEGGPVDSSCVHFTAEGDNANPFIITIDDSAYYQGEVTYRIRFEGTNGAVFWTPTWSFFCYDDEDPTTGSAVFNAAPSYTSSLSISIPIADTGGSNLDTAKLVWNYNTDPVETATLSTNVIDPPTGLDSATANFIIPTDYLQVGDILHFQVWVYDRAGNKGSSSVYTVTPTDSVDPGIEIWYQSYYWDENVAGGVNICELGYPLIIKWRVIEPTQASGIPNDNSNLFVGIKDGEIAPTDETDYDTLYNFPSIYESTYIYTFTLDHDYSSDDWFQVFIYAEDASGNSNFMNISLFVLDNRAPDVVESPENIIAPNFDSNLELNFSAWEPTKANGVDSSSISLKYTIDDPSVSSNGISLTPDSISDANGYFNRTYVINENLFNYGNTIYYIYEVSDNTAGNKYSTGVRSLSVEDFYNPEMTIITESSATNWSIVYSYWDTSIAVNVNDQVGGSGIEFVRLYILNGSNFLGFSNVEAWSYFEPTQSVGNSEFHFIIPEENITIDGIAIAIRVYDVAGNYFEITQYKEVYDSTKPIVERYSLGTVNERYLGRMATDFYFKLSIPAFMFYAVDGDRNLDTITSNNISVPLNFDGEGEHIISVFFNDYLWEKIIIVDITAPNVVASIDAKLNGGEHSITWVAPTGLLPGESLTYRLYRSTEKDFNISSGELITETSELSYSYKYDETGSFYYRVIAVDEALNIGESSPCSKAIVTVESKTTAVTLIAIGSVATIAIVSVIAVKKRRAFYGIAKNASKGDLKGHGGGKFKKGINFSKPESDQPKDTAPFSEKPKVKAKKNQPPKELPKELDNVKNNLSPEAQKLLSENAPTSEEDGWN